MATKKPDPKKPWAPEPGGAPHTKVERDAQRILRAQVMKIADQIFDRYIDGESFYQIAQSLPFKCPSWKLRTILMEDEATRDLYENAALNRAHGLVESAVDYGRQAAAIGDAAGLRTAIDVNLKVASKMAPREYGDSKKVELTGANGGPIKMVALTDEQLMEIASRAAGGESA